MTIKTIDELNTDFADGQVATITAQKIRDLLDSLASIGGTMYGNDQSIDLTTAWQPFAWFTNSIDTKGLTENLTQGHFTLAAGTDGVYAVDVSMGFFSNVAGWVEIAVTKNGNLTPYRSRRTLTAGGDGVSGIVANGNLVATDTVGLAIRASGEATITLRNGQFRAIRI
jgi:hypothetical protein